MRNYTFDATDVKAEDIITVDNITKYCNFGDLGKLNLDINRFNQNYNSDLGYTKGFTFKPGTVDKISHIISDYLYLIKTPNQRGKRTPARMFDNIRNSRWRINNLRDAFNGINRQLMGIRQTGLTFDSFKDSLKEVPKQFIDFITECNKILTPFKANLSIKDVRTPNLGMTDRDYGFDGIVLLFEMELKKPVMTIVGDNDTFVGDIPFSGDILINISSSIKDAIDAFGFKINDRKVSAYNTTNVIISAIHSAGTGLYHPYLNSNNEGGTCSGNIQSSIQSSFKAFNFVELITHIDTWLTTFKLGYTYPLNRPNMMYFGIPEALPEDLKDKLGQNIDNCGSRILSKFELYKDAVEICDGTKCTLRDGCDYYTRWSDKDKQEEQVKHMENRKKLSKWISEIEDEYCNHIEFNNEDLYDYIWNSGETHGIEGMRRACDLEIVSPYMTLFLDLLKSDNDIRVQSDIVRIFGYHPLAPSPKQLDDSWDLYEPHTLYNFVWFTYLEVGPDVLYDMFLEAMDFRDMYLQAYYTVPKVIAETCPDIAERYPNPGDTERAMLNWAAAGGPAVGLDINDVSDENPF